MSLTGATPLPRHQPQKSIHFAWYRREVDDLMQPDISIADPLEKPNFRRIRWFSAWTPWWKRLKWGCCNSRPHQGSARGGWVSRRRRSVNHSFSGQRGATRVMERLRVSLTRPITLQTRGKGRNAYTSRLSQRWRNTSSKTA